MSKIDMHTAYAFYMRSGNYQPQIPNDLTQRNQPA